MKVDVCRRVCVWDDGDRMVLQTFPVDRLQQTLGDAVEVQALEVRALGAYVVSLEDGTVTAYPMRNVEWWELDQ